MTQFDEIQIAISRLINTLTGGLHNEMFSSRVYRLSMMSNKWNMVRKLLDAMFFWQANHCKASYNWEHQ